MDTTINDSLLIGGTWRSPRGDEADDVINPATGDLITRVARASEADVDEAVTTAADAFHHGWRSTTPRERGDLLLQLVDAIAEDAEELIRVEALNGGKPLSGARWEIEDFVM